MRQVALAGHHVVEAMLIATPRCSGMARGYCGFKLGAVSRSRPSLVGAGRARCRPLEHRQAIDSGLSGRVCRDGWLIFGSAVVFATRSSTRRVGLGGVQWQGFVL